MINRCYLDLFPKLAHIGICHQNFEYFGGGGDPQFSFNKEFTIRPGPTIIPNTKKRQILRYFRNFCWKNPQTKPTNETIAIAKAGRLL
jgi:hypothetical protein